MNTSRRTAGLGLLAFGIVTPAAVIISKMPGVGIPHEERNIAEYLVSSNRAGGNTAAFLAGIAALGVLVFANWMRHELRSSGDLLWGLAIVGTGLAVAGWFLLGGMGLSVGEAGVASGLPHQVVYLNVHMASSVAIEASSLVISIAVLVLAARTALPGWLRVASYVGALGGLTGVIFMPLYLFWLWAILFGLWAVMGKASSTQGATV